MALKFGDVQSLTERDIARRTVARSEAMQDFPDKAIIQLVDLIDDTRIDNRGEIGRREMMRLIRGWLDSVYEDKEA